MDVSDQATAREELERSLSLKFRKPELPYTGFCYNCDERIQQPAKFCDQFCRDDHATRTRKGR